jgi:hypothetical protein
MMDSDLGVALWLSQRRLPSGTRKPRRLWRRKDRSAPSKHSNKLAGSRQRRVLVPQQDETSVCAHSLRPRR